MPERSPKIIQDVQFEYFQWPGFLLELKESWALEQTPRLLHFNSSTSSATTSLVAQETWYDPDYDEICTLEKLPKDRLWRSQFLVKPDAIRYPMPCKRSLVWWSFVHFSTVSGLQTPWNAVKSSRSTSLYWRFIERVPFRRPPLHKPFIGMKLEPGECPEAVRFTFRHFWEAVIGCGTRQFVLARKVHLPWRWLRWQTSDRLSCGYAIQSNTAIQHRPADLWKSWPT